MSPRPSARHAGMTLLELLLALAIAAAATALAGTALIACLRLARGAGERIDALATAETALTVVADDLAQAVDVGGRRFRIDAERGTLACTTLHRIAGEPAGLRSVTWRYDAERAALLRTLPGPEGERVVAVGIAAVRFEAGEDGVPAAIVAAAGEELRLPLLAEPSR